MIDGSYLGNVFNSIATLHCGISKGADPKYRVSHMYDGIIVGLTDYVSFEVADVSVSIDAVYSDVDGHFSGGVYEDSDGYTEIILSNITKTLIAANAFFQRQYQHGWNLPRPIYPNIKNGSPLIDLNGGIPYSNGDILEIDLSTHPDLYTFADNNKLFVRGIIQGTSGSYSVKYYDEYGQEVSGVPGYENTLVYSPVRKVVFTYSGSGTSNVNFDGLYRQLDLSTYTTVERDPYNAVVSNGAITFSAHHANRYLYNCTNSIGIDCTFYIKQKGGIRYETKSINSGGSVIFNAPVNTNFMGFLLFKVDIYGTKTPIEYNEVAYTQDYETKNVVVTNISDRTLEITAEWVV